MGQSFVDEKFFEIIDELLGYVVSFHLIEYLVFGEVKPDST
jgi:hypothetical protein